MLTQPPQRHGPARGMRSLMLIGAAVLAAHLALLGWIGVGSRPAAGPPHALLLQVLPASTGATPHTAHPGAPPAAQAEVPARAAADARPPAPAAPKRRPAPASAASPPASNPPTAAPEPAPARTTATVATTAVAGAAAAPSAQPAGSDTPAAQTGRPGLSGKPSSAPGADGVEPPSSKADYLNNPPPPYPAISRRLGEQGQVLIEALISKDGIAIQASVERSSGFQRLDQAALDTVRRWRFVPGRRAGAAQDMWFRIPITFALDQGPAAAP